MWAVRGKEYRVTREDVIERESTSMQRVAEIKNSHVLTIHGDHDETIPVADAYTFGQHIQGMKLVIVTGGSHFFLSDPEVQAVKTAVTAFLAL